MLVKSPQLFTCLAQPDIPSPTRPSIASIARRAPRLSLTSFILERRTSVAFQPVKSLTKPEDSVPTIALAASSPSWLAMLSQSSSLLITLARLSYSTRFTVSSI